MRHVFAGFFKLSKRGPQCTVCASKHRAQIELAIVHRVPGRVIAARFGVSKDSVYRHAHSHLSPVQRAALLAAQRPTAVDLDALRTSESEGLLSQLVAQRARLQQTAELSLELGDVRGAVSAESAITANLALVGKLLGQLVQIHDVRHTNLLISPDYLELRRTLIAALRPFPEAARAVSSALHRLETEAAAEMAKPVREAPVVLEHVPQPAPIKFPPPPC